MTLSRFRVALVLPLAFGCAHAVYDGQPDLSDTDNSVTDQPVSSGAGRASVVNSLPGTGSGAGVAGSSDGTGGASAESGGATGFAGSTGSAGKSSAGGATASGAGGAIGSAGAATAHGGAASAGAASGGAPSAGAPNGGAPSAGAASGGAPSAGASSGGAASTGCSGISTWMKGTYKPGDKVQAGGKLYQCKPGNESGWCGLDEMFYAPGTGLAWGDAWNLIGPC